MLDLGGQGIIPSNNKSFVGLSKCVFMPQLRKTDNRRLGITIFHNGLTLKEFRFLEIIDIILYYLNHI